MGVAGTGKSTVGAALARELAWEFIEADAFHPPRNVAKMRRGEPLDDDDRRPWLARVRARIERCEDAVVACSALKSRYRKVLLHGLEAQVVYLHGARELLAKRLAERRGHFFKAGLLDSQLETLEPPKGAIEIDVSRTVEDIVSQLAACIASPARRPPPPAPAPRRRAGGSTRRRPSAGAGRSRPAR